MPCWANLEKSMLLNLGKCRHRTFCSGIGAIEEAVMQLSAAFTEVRSEAAAGSHALASAFRRPLPAPVSPAPLCCRRRQMGDGGSSPGHRPTSPCYLRPVALS
eukprot:6666454-Pyramimonas_sp.AAC.1